MTEADARPDTRLKRIAFRAWRRGTRESDLVMGPFVDRYGGDLTESEISDLERLLDIDDEYLYGWVVGRAPVPVEHDGPVMRRLRTFLRDEVAAEVAQKASGGIG